ncbi:MAG: sulfatase [Chloroflexi bacterium]|nr:sulfatase [Chloroflexota bacterium]
MNIFIYVMDSLRPDFIGCYNFEEHNTPNIDDFAGDAVRFSLAFSQATWSKPSATSILTGSYPDSLGMLHTRHRLNPAIPTLTKMLKKAGYRTLGLSTNEFVSEVFGFHPGFDSFPDLSNDPRFAERQYYKLSIDNWTSQHPIILSDDYNPMVEEWINPAANNFGLIWCMDTHQPLFDPHLLKTEGKVDLRYYHEVTPETHDEYINVYRQKIQFNDESFGQFIEILKAKGIYDDSLIVLLSDHGEGLGQHEVYTHAELPFNEQIHVPLLIKFPGSRFAGQVSDELVELTDVVPTILEVANLKSEWRLQGKSLIPTLQSGGTHRRYVYSIGQASAKDTFYFSIRGRRWKYLYVNNPRPRRELFKWFRWTFLVGHWFFNFDLDPDEIQHYENYTGNWRRRDWRFRYGQLMAVWRLFTNWLYFKRHVKHTMIAILDETVKARLQALGYLE